MASNDLYEMRFEWPHREPSTVLVTGTFDQWSRSVKLTKTDTGFVGSVQVPWAEKVKYKFIVDGRWYTQAGQPTETDPGGYVNNIYFTPPKPLILAAPPAEELNGNATHEEAAATPEEPVESPPTVPEEPPKKQPDIAEQPARSTGRRMSIPIVPVNAVEHNTIGSTTLPPPVPDYVLPPPPPRARSASPPPPESKKVVATQEVTPEPEPAKLHEVEVEITTPEPVIAVAPEVPIEERKQEAEAHIPVDDGKPVPEPVHEPKEVEEIVAPEPVPEVTPTPSIAISKPEEQAEEKSEKKEKPITSSLPTPPASPSPKKSFFHRRSSSTSHSSSSLPTPSGSPSSSRFGTEKSRKKKLSLIGKIKEIFHHDHKDKEVEKVAK
ncbi:hypothetical protein D9611_002252 [Ephemerocybe angulata]|uniref:AMP-activated protein kinase glycogen-binding domain-containing protein n=1 Tax=Ephemerocybe angulata TaxID=980116 RepID=A0A8H5FED4_9AGAR|nr:hypothetical protein D9611_002252 [Tulosesus angulatus]